MASTYMDIFWQWGGGDDYLVVNNGRLELSKFPDGLSTPVSSRMVFTKFGGTVGFIGKNSWTGSSVLFDPTATGYADYTTIPEYTGGAPASFGEPRVSKDSYHNLENVLAGRGDICRLVGMTVDQILGFAGDDELYAAESGWRLPTDYENQFFVVGYSDSPNYSQSTSETGSTIGNFFNQSSPRNPNFDNPGIAFVPAIKGPSYNIAGMRLPALGARSGNGASWQTAGQEGYYWSSTPKSADNGAALKVGNGVIETSQSQPKNQGFAVRCVRSDDGQ